MRLPRCPIVPLALPGDALGATWSSTAFVDRLLRERLLHVRTATFPCRVTGLHELVALGDVEVAEHLGERLAVLLRVEPRMLALLEVSHGAGELSIAGADRGDVDRVAAAFAAGLRDDGDGGGDGEPGYSR